MKTKKKLTVAEQIVKKEKEASFCIFGVILNFSLSAAVLIGGILIIILGEAVGEIVDMVTFIGTVILFFSGGIFSIHERKRLKREIFELQQQDKQQSNTDGSNT